MFQLRISEDRIRSTLNSLRNKVYTGTLLSKVRILTYGKTTESRVG